MSAEVNDFYEDDEPVEEIRAAFEAGPKSLTTAPTTTYGTAKTLVYATGGNDVAPWRLEELRAEWYRRRDIVDATTDVIEENQMLGRALRSIINVLGPEQICDCDHDPHCGLPAEADDALRIAREALVKMVYGVD
jgi:hypothetical protein